MTGHWVALDQGTDRRHDCPGLPEPGPPEPPPPPDWVETRSVGPLTFAAACPWCSARVFFHRNRARRDILLDDLGPRFTVHRCWVAHARGRKDAARTLISAQGRPDYRCDCGKYRGAKFAGVVCDCCGKELKTHGFLFNRRRVRRINRPARDGRHRIHGHVLRTRARSVDVADATDARTRFTLPSPTALKLQQGDIVAMLGQSQQRGRRRRLIALEFRRWDPLTRAALSTWRSA